MAYRGLISARLLNTAINALKEVLIDTLHQLIEGLCVLSVSLGLNILAVNPQTNIADRATWRERRWIDR